MSVANVARRSMLSVAEAETTINQTISLGQSESCPISRAVGRLLREEIRADRDFPPFDRVSMDGIAFAYADFEAGERRFRIAGMQPAGAPAGTLDASGDCLEVMTGAVLPRGCDCVVPVEEIERSGDMAEIKPEARPVRLQHVHRRGSDYPFGSLLIPAGTRLLPPHIAVCAAVGRSRLLVSREPRIALVATGDELVEVGEPVSAHQVRISNVYAVEAALAARGYRDTRRFHARDEREAVRGILSQALASFDVVVISGGVSAGKLDLVPEILEALGARELFHKVRQRPGLPFWFGIGPGNRAVFALPGNPVSTLVCAYRYLLPYLEAALGAPPGAPEHALLAEDFDFDQPLTLFLPVRLERAARGELLAHPRPIHGSGDFARLTGSDGFIELPEGGRHFPAGSLWPLYRWSPLTSVGAEELPLEAEAEA